MSKKFDNKGPGLFSDIGKKAREILYKDYTFDKKVSISTQAQNGLVFTSSSLQKEGLSLADVAVQYKDEDIIIDVKGDTQSNITATTTVVHIIPNVRSIVSAKLPYFNTEKVEAQYFHDHAAISSTVSFKPLVVDVSATFGTLGTVLGVEAGCDPATGGLTKFSAGISITKPKFCTSYILADKGDLLKASYVHYLDQWRATTAVEFTNRFSVDGSTLTVGGSCAVDDLTLIKLKLDNQGTFGAVLQHEFKPKSLLTIAAEFDYNSLDTNPKFGLSLAMKS